MTSEAGGAITLLTGAITLRLALTGDYKRYVRPGMGPLLAIAGVLLVAVGLLVVVGALRRPPGSRPGPVGDGDDHDDQNDGAHEDHEPERVGWLVLAPVLAVLLVAPPALGAFAVDRVSRVEVSAGTLFEPLEAGAEPRSMALLEFMQRAGDRDGQSFSGAMVELTGFVAGGDGPGFDLARYSIACCAADAAVAVVSVLDNGPAPARDQWVRVVGSYEPGSAARPTLRALSVEPASTPDDPYE